MTLLLGLDGCRGGWVGALLTPAGAVSWHFLPDLRAALTLGADVVAVDIPIGLPDAGPRRCDQLARARLGPRASSVFPAPVRATLAATTYAEARALSVAAHGGSLSAQAYGLVAKIREVDQTLTPQDHLRVFEAHPEVSLHTLANRTLANRTLANRTLASTKQPGRDLAGKKSAGGALARTQLLTAHFGALPDDVPVQAGLDDALDALACLWTAQRWARGAAETLGGEPDGRGVPMRIVV